MFDELYSRVRYYAQQRRLDEIARKSKGDPMDTGQLQQPQWRPEWQEEEEWQEEQAWYESYDAYVNALSKGKSSIKGKGKGNGPKGQSRGPC